MQTRLFFSTVFAVLGLTPAALACGPDSSDQLSQAQFTVVTSHDHHVLKLNGKTAQTVFEHLNDPEVRRFNTNFIQFKVGFGILCVGEPAREHYHCWEKISAEGEVQNYFPFKDSLKKSAHWLQLNLKGQTMEALYQKMSEDGDMAELEDGSIEFIKQRTGLTCTKRINLDGSASFQCSQVLSAGGLPIGPGTDPMIGSGTHPVLLDVEEGVH
jgi:hypothetical protein